MAHAQNTDLSAVTYAPGRPWKPGQSGNPGGRPKAIGHVRDLARELTDDAIQTLATVMHDPKAPPGARVAAAVAILDRGWGKPTQGVTLERDTSQVQNNADMRAAWNDAMAHAIESVAKLGVPVPLISPASHRNSPSPDPVRAIRTGEASEPESFSLRLSGG